jgi:transposase
MLQLPRVLKIGTISSIDLQAFYPASLRVTKITESEKTLTIHLKSLKHNHCCPGCGQDMSVYHGTYKRTVQDLPIFQKNVLLHISAYEYYCLDDTCDVKSFAEDYGGFIKRSERVTDRLGAFIQMLAFETNCEGAAAICKEMGIRVSGDTIIRMLRKLTGISIPPSSDIIGVDEFAYRKGHTYCTVICDGVTREPIDILDGRDGEALREWLRKNKQIKKITRDRAGAYAKAISNELPDAMQIADRFHLHQNLLKAVKEALKHALPNNIAIPNDLESVISEPDTDKKNKSRTAFDS